MNTISMRFSRAGTYVLTTHTSPSCRVSISLVRAGVMVAVDMVAVVPIAAEQHQVNYAQYADARMLEADPAVSTLSIKQVRPCMTCLRL